MIATAPTAIRCFVLMLAFDADPKPLHELTGKVVHIADGDTLTVLDAGGRINSAIQSTSEATFRGPEVLANRIAPPYAGNDQSVFPGRRPPIVPLQFCTVQIGSPRQPEEGLRIGTVRFLPRGVRKVDYGKRDLFDLWLPILAPSRELLKAFRDGDVSPAKFFQRYQSEMAETDPRQVIQLLAALAHQTSLSVACYCDDESRSHRSVLGTLIREAAGDSEPISPRKRNMPHSSGT
jgi:uncharacterized protein YeaO (DUF488 family)